MWENLPYSTGSSVNGTRLSTTSPVSPVTASSNRRNGGGKGFWLVDTGGFFGPDDDPLSPVVQEQIERTARTASVLIMILDAQTGPTPLDRDVLDLLRRFHIPIVAAVNKVDNPAAEWELIAPFYELGFSEIFPISAMHGTGTGDMLDAVVEYLPDDAPFEPEPIPGIAIIGRPNVGKSTLLNGLCGTDRSIVSPIAGTTRDPVDTEIEVNGKRYLLIDTAGIRRRGKMSQGLDRYSLLRAKKALDRCDLALMLINAEEGLTESDARVFGLAQDAGKAAIILVNKWDLVEKDQDSAGTFAKNVRDEVPFLHYAPIEFISALTKKRIHRIFPHVEEILDNYYFRVPTAELNTLLEGILQRHPPPVHRGQAPRIYYWTQVSAGPPTFIAFVSDPKAIHFSYQRYLINRLYETFEFKGTPLRPFLKTAGKRETK